MIDKTTKILYSILFSVTVIFVVATNIVYTAQAQPQSISSWRCPPNMQYDAYICGGVDLTNYGSNQSQGVKNGLEFVFGGLRGHGTYELQVLLGNAEPANYTVQYELKMYDNEEANAVVKTLEHSCDVQCKVILLGKQPIQHDNLKLKILSSFSSKQLQSDTVVNLLVENELKTMFNSVLCVVMVLGSSVVSIVAVIAYKALKRNLASGEMDGFKQKNNYNSNLQAQIIVLGALPLFINPIRLFCDEINNLWMWIAQAVLKAGYLVSLLLFELDGVNKKNHKIYGSIFTFLGIFTVELMNILSKFNLVNYTIEFAVLGVCCLLQSFIFSAHFVIYRQFSLKSCTLVGLMVGYLLNRVLCVGNLDLNGFDCGIWLFQLLNSFQIMNLKKVKK